jgi:hypothetical protein
LLILWLERGIVPMGDVPVFEDDPIPPPPQPGDPDFIGPLPAGFEPGIPEA